MRFPRFGLNAIRTIEILSALGFCYLAYQAREFPWGSDIIACIELVAGLPFVVAFAWLTRGPSGSQWVAVRVIHQALAIIVLAVAAISLAGLPDTALGFTCLAAAGALQLLAAEGVRRIAHELPKLSRWHRVLRVSLVFLFALAFLLLK